MPLLATKSNVVSTKSNVASTCCCWCGRGLTVIGAVHVEARRTTSASRRLSTFCARSSSTLRIARCTLSNVLTTTTTDVYRRSSSDSFATKWRRRKHFSTSTQLSFINTLNIFTHAAVCKSVCLSIRYPKHRCS